MSKWYHAILPPSSPLHLRLRTIYLVHIQGKRRLLQDAVRTAPAPLKVNLGAATTDIPGWIASDFPVFNIVNAAHWELFFGPKKAQNLLAEHVLEHLTYAQVDLTFQNAYRTLAPGGVFRIAVPDAMNPAPDYFNHCKPLDGPGSNEQHDHKIFWCRHSLGNLARRNGFKVEAREFYDENGQLTAQTLDDQRGVLRRVASKNYKTVNQGNYVYNSLVLDLVK